MSVELLVRPNDPPITWRKFCKITEPFSIALDGYVAAEPCFQEKGPRVNFNHHEGVDRLATRATCGQVILAIRQGLFDCFRDENKNPEAKIYVNDCDEDVCVSVFLLKHKWWVEHATNLAINRLVYIEDLLDATAGAYPFPIDMPMLQEFAWIFEPYRRFRLIGGLDLRKAEDFEGVITDVDARIKNYITGQGEKIPLDTRYEVIRNENNWALIKEIGAQARTGVFADGIRAFVSVRKRFDDKWSYVIGRMSPFIRFHIIRICKELNKIEGTKKDKWGGGNNIAGSPRINGSKLFPDEITDIINQVNEKFYNQ